MLYNPEFENVFVIFQVNYHIVYNTEFLLNMASCVSSIKQSAYLFYDVTKQKCFHL